MNRRRFLHHTGAAAGLAFTPMAAAPALAANRRTWQMISRWPERFPDQYVAAERLARRIAAMSDGRLSIEVLPPNALGDYKKTLDLVQRGEVEMSRSLSYDWRGRGWAFDVFTFVPLGMTEFERAVWLQNYGGQALWDGLYADLGAKPFLCGSVGPQAFGWFREPIRSTRQLEGLRYRTTGITERIMAALGAKPTVMPLEQIGPAVEAGELDAFELVGPAVDLAYDLHRYLPVYVFPSFHQTSGSIELVINKPAWEALPEDLKAVVAVACQAEHAANLADVQAGNARALSRLVSEHGVRVETLPAEVLTAIGRVTGEVLEEVRAEAAPAHRRVFESFLAARRSLGAWSDVTESAFLAARQLPFGYPS